jgi:hypothetical protein
MKQAGMRHFNDFLTKLGVQRGSVEIEARRSAVRNAREASSTARPLEYGRIAFENVLGDIVTFLSAELRMFGWPYANFGVTRWPPDLFSPVKSGNVARKAARRRENLVPSRFSLRVRNPLTKK